MTQPGVFDLLAASGPFPGSAEELKLYTPLIGSWDIDVTWYGPAGETKTGKGEWHFRWILDGLGVQDVLFGAGSPPHKYGTTLRCYDQSQGVWHVFWAQPAGGEFVQLVGKRIGKRIVQQGVGPDQNRRWSFTNVTPDSFTWLGEVSQDQGVSWFLEQEMRATRRVNA